MNKNFNEIKIFENYEIKHSSEFKAVVSTKVMESSLNLYQNAHGGYLFSLCDAVSGYVLINNGIDVVTLSSSINYLSAAKLDDLLTINAEIVHNGKRTKVIETKITNQDDKVITRATFTMYVI